jgi:hypothetical protein
MYVVVRQKVYSMLLISSTRRSLLSRPVPSAAGGSGQPAPAFRNERNCTSGVRTTVSASWIPGSCFGLLAVLLPYCSCCWMLLQFFVDETRRPVPRKVKKFVLIN